MASASAILLSAALVLQPASPEEARAHRIEMAKALVAQMAQGRFEKAVEPFDEVMIRAVPADKLKQVWEGIIGRHGPLQNATETRVERVQQYHVVFVTTKLERGKLDTKVVFNDDNEITGLFFLPAGRYKSPPYVDPSSFDDVEITVGKGVWKLPGTLSLPGGEGPLRAAVLVHGSGPQDRDETIGPNKPFRDLAHGLASKGIAVLRYEKRTKHHRLKMALLSGSITVKEETVDDAAAAVEALAAHEKIDGEKIFVLGHSLGGNLIPRIARANDRVAGFISLAGSTRPLEDLVIDQTRYVLSLDGQITADEQQQIDEIEQQVQRVKSLDAGDDTGQGDLPLDIPAKYWLDLRGYHPAEDAATIEKPMLFLQGDRDYQVTLEDFEGWKKSLDGRPDVKFIRYAKLNHLFIEGQGKSTPAEYSAPGNVAEVVVKDITRWLRAQE